MYSSTIELPRVLEKEKDPLNIDRDIQVKQEVDDLDDSEVPVNRKNKNIIVIKEDVTDNDFTSETQLFINKEKIVKILPFTKGPQPEVEHLGCNFSHETLKIKKETPCNCMQNIDYYCNKCDKMLFHIDRVNQCSECHSQLKLQCRLCCKRYKLIKSILTHSTSINIKKEIDITAEQHFSCFKCSFKATGKRSLDDHIFRNNHKPSLFFMNYSSTVSNNKNTKVLVCYMSKFSTKVNDNPNFHIFKTHCQSKLDVDINCDDDMYIELLCKKCQKICKKVVYDNVVKLVCRECQVPMLYRCTLCHNRYKLLKNVRYHVKCICSNRMNNEKFYCADCTFKIDTKAKLENHIIKQHISQEYSNYREILKDNNALKEHLLEHCAVKKVNDHPGKLELPCKESINEDDKFVIVQYNPHIIGKDINGKPSKNTKEWRSLIDYLCLKCGEEAKKKFSRYRPWCRKCNLKYDYRCISCDKLYGNYDRIHHHVTVSCPNRLIFECPLCKHNASNKFLLFNHIETKHTIYKCMECLKNVEGTPELKKHKIIGCRKDHLQSPAELDKLIHLYCEQCCKRPRKIVNTVTARCVKCTTILSYQCLKCLNAFHSRDLAYKHIKELCKPKFSCDICTFETYTQGALDIHTRCKHMIRKCPDCGVRFKDELIFQLHIKEENRKKRKELFDIIPHLKKLKPSCI